MKTLLATVAAIALASSAFAGQTLIRSNVPAASGSVPGFHLGGVGFFVAEGYEDRVTVDAIVVPASIDVKDLEGVEAWLAEMGYTNVSPRIETSRTVLVEVAPGVFEEQRQHIPAYAQRWQLSAHKNKKPCRFGGAFSFSQPCFALHF